MNNKEYDKLVKSVVGKESTLKNVMIAFISGGLVGVIAQMMSEFYFKVFLFYCSNAIFKCGGHFIFEKSITDLLGKINQIPKRLSLIDQGEFILGYYHQVQYRFSKKEEK